MDCSFRFISQKGSRTIVCTISREASAATVWIYSLRIASLKGSTASEAIAGSPISGQLDVEQSQESQGFKS